MAKERLKSPTYQLDVAHVRIDRLLVALQLRNKSYSILLSDIAVICSERRFIRTFEAIKDSSSCYQDVVKPHPTFPGGWLVLGLMSWPKRSTQYKEISQSPFFMVQIHLNTGAKTVLSLCMVKDGLDTLLEAWQLQKIADFTNRPTFMEKERGRVTP